MSDEIPIQVALLFFGALGNQGQVYHIKQHKTAKSFLKISSPFHDQLFCENASIAERTSTKIQKAARFGLLPRVCLSFLNALTNLFGIRYLPDIEKSFKEILSCAPDENDVRLSPLRPFVKIESIDDFARKVDTLLKSDLRNCPYIS